MTMTFEDATRGTTAPAEVLAQLTLLEVPFYGFDDHEHTGWLVVHRNLEREIATIFHHLTQMQFPIEKITPIVAYGWDDEKSMADNNTSCFNYRLISGTTTPSRHGLGRAIDINPRINPYFGRLGTEPKGATYDPATKGAIVPGNIVTKIFATYDWEWLGRRVEYPDYQHFQKTA